jgi:SAM-dependent methyltransferase
MTSRCVWCDAEAATVLFTRRPDFDPAGREFSVLRCRRCGVERLDPMPTEAELDAAYGRDYYAEHSPEAGASGALRRLAWRVEIRPLKPFLRPSARVLEVGCGTGGFLAEIRARYGAEVFGVDRSPAAIEAARRRGISAERGFIDDVASRGETFDVVALRHVLEHVSAPRDLLRTARGLLAERGALLTTVPVTGGWDQRALGESWEGYEIPEHLWIPTRTALNGMLADAGFSVRSRSYSVVPNPWVNAANRTLARRGRERAARAASIHNPVALALASPLGLAAGLARRSGRLTVVATKR